MTDRNPVPSSKYPAYREHGADSPDGFDEPPVTRPSDGSAVKDAIRAAGKGPRPAPGVKR